MERSFYTFSSREGGYALDNGYIAPTAALRKLRAARSLSQTVYVYGGTGFGKTELVRQYLSKRRYLYLSCGDFSWNWDTAQVVVIDDLHLLRDQERRQEVLALTRRRDVWLILIGRSAIPSWLLPAYVSEGFIVVTEADLALREKEVAGYLDSCQVSYTQEQLQRLARNTEGNAYALRHAALRMKEGACPGPELYQEVASAFSNYLEYSVLTSLDSDLLEFLMQISVVDEFTLELAEMVTANGHALELLERALEAGSFLTQEDGVYRLRPFQLHALRSRAAKVLGMDQVRAFAASAGHYYAIHDQIVPALKLYEFSGSAECIRELLIRNARLNPGNGHYYELRRYYMSMDEKDIEASPVLMACMSMLCSMLMDGEKSEYWYGKLKAYADTAKGGAKREAQSRLAYLDIGLPHRGSSDTKEILLRIPALLFDKGISLPEFSVTSNMPSIMNGGKDFCHWSRSDRMLASTIGSLVERVLGRYGKGLVKAALGESLYEKGEDTYEVLSLLSRAQMETERGGVPEIAFAAVGLRARLSLLYGNMAEAKALISSFEASVREQNALQLLPNIQALKCRLALCEGDMGSVNQWMDTAPDENKEFCSLERYRYLTKVRCYLSAGENLRAMALLEKLYDYAGQCHRDYIRMEAGILTAVARERQGAAWQECLLAALEDACGFSFIRLVSEEGAAVRPLLLRLQEEGADRERLNPEWFCRVLTETEAAAQRYPLYLQKQTAGDGSFSETARNILRLQAAGLSVPQIAQKLGAKPDTIKYHIKENYRKLGVRTKADALLAARGLGLL